MNGLRPRPGDHGLGAELFGGLGSPEASPARRLFLARWCLLLVLPLVVAPTGLNQMISPGLGHAPEAGQRLAVAWFVFAACFLFGSIAVVYARGAGPLGRWGMLAAIAGLLVTNQITMLEESSLGTWATLFIAAVIASMRVFLDYRSGLFATLLGAGGLALGVYIEWLGLFPLGPVAAVPVVDPRYDHPGMLFGVVAVAVAALVLTFMAVNFGMNQTHKLHTWMTRVVLARYLPPGVVERAVAGELDLEGPPERRIITVVFTDLVGFTSLTERVGAERVAELLNVYLSEMSLLAHAHGATIDKFIGDAVMLVYGAPEAMPPEEQARQAVALGHEMVRKVASILDGQLELRVGIETGEGVVGNFGSSTRSDYTVIGGVVNLAARLESVASPSTICVGPGTAAHLPPDTLESMGDLNLKGFGKPVSVWRALPGSRRRVASGA